MQVLLSSCYLYESLPNFFLAIYVEYAIFHNLNCRTNQIYSTNKSGVLYQASSASAFTPLLLQFSNDFFNLNDVVSFAI